VNRAEFLIDGQNVLPALLRDIAEAQRNIHMSMFLFFRDPIGEEIARALAQKASEGLSVRLMLNIEKTRIGDPFSTGEKKMIDRDPSVQHNPLDVAPLCKWMREQGVQVVDTNIDYGHTVPVADTRLRAIAAQIKDTIAIDELHIDHRKIIIIDGQISYCGGANIGAQYLFHDPFDPTQEAVAEAEALKAAGHREPWWKWHDSLTRFQGPVSAELDAHFHDRWVLDGGADYALPEPLPKPPRGFPIDRATVCLNEPNDHPNPVRALYLECIREARESIFIENPYTYHPAIAEALVAAKAARPSLRVDLIVPALTWNDNPLAHDAGQYWYRQYLKVGIGVHEYQNHFNHLKVAAFDGRSSIHGSTNLNFRSLEDDKDFELVVFIEDERMAKQVLTEVRDIDLPRSRTFGPADLRGFKGRFQVCTRDPRTLLLVSRKVL
jgi:cardiolipin synthase